LRFPITHFTFKTTKDNHLDGRHQLKRSPFFVRRGGHCCRGDLVGWTTSWFFFWVACKSYSNGL